ncbi:hypothetical protein ACIBK9_23850 [Nonomuraea sp. NPDC050227]|uniref:hypothetical protein n=1 Tax=Nonomuraea sp. NPDC050227 TaxID=3364360 RepID=UPI00379B0538
MRSFILVLLLVAGCGAAGPEPPAGCGASARTGPLDTRVLRQVVYDYPASPTPEALAGKVETVVTGHVTGWVAGPVVEEGILGDRTHYVLMRTQVGERLKAAAADVADVAFYQGAAVDDAGTPVHSVADFARAVPPGTRVLLFMNRARPTGKVVEGRAVAWSTPPQGVILHEVTDDPGGRAVGGRDEIFSSTGWNQPCGIDGLIARLRAHGVTG